MLVYYQDFGTTSNYRIQNYSASLDVLNRCTGASTSRRLFPRLPPPAAAPAASAATARWGWSAVMLE